MPALLTGLASRLLTLAVILLLTFLLLHLVPGNPFASDRGLPPEIEANLYEKYGLNKRGDQTFLIWFAKDTASYVEQLAHGRLGPSLKYVDRDVTAIIKEALPASFLLGGWSVVLALTAALLTAIALSLLNNRALEAVFFFLSSLTISMPGFMKAVVLVAIFSLTLKWLPPALWEGPEYLILPILTLALAPYFLMLEFLLAEIRKEEGKFYVLAARAKGLSERVILVKHVLRNSLNPLLALLGPIAASLVTGSFIVETIFSIPGLGRHFILAVIDRDYFLVMGITLVFAALLSLFNLVTEAIGRLIDPRLKGGRT